MKRFTILHTYDDPKKDRSLQDLLHHLEHIGIKCDIKDKEREYGNYSLILEWDTNDVQQKTTRNAGAKRKHISLKDRKVEDIRKRMETESAEEVAKSLGISRATLFRKLKEAEEMEDDEIW